MARHTLLDINDYPLPPKPLYSSAPSCMGNELKLIDCPSINTKEEAAVVIHCEGTLDGNILKYMHTYILACNVHN